MLKNFSRIFCTSFIFVSPEFLFFCPLDKDLGLESPLILNPQSSSPMMSEKAKVEGLLGAEGQFEKVQQAELALKDSSGCFEHPASSSASVPEGQWAQDALRNCEYHPGLGSGGGVGPTAHFHPFPISLGWVRQQELGLHALAFRHLLDFLGFIK